MPTGLAAGSCPVWSTRTATSGSATHGATDLDEAIAQAETERDAGALLLRDAGSPIDTRSLDDRDDLPRIIRAGRHLARPKRYTARVRRSSSRTSRSCPRRSPSRPAGVTAGSSWSATGSTAASAIWRRCGPTTCSSEAIDAAHAEGARVTAHVFGEDALPGLINAGIDCIEHGTGITDDVIALMVEHGTALVPTLINIENFPGIADAAAKYPTYAAHMRDLYASCRDRMGAAHDAGVPIYAGTDAGSMIAHGRIADEVDALKTVGLSPTDALGAACWDARAWLGRPGLEHGASADLVCYAEDPRTGADVSTSPT